MAIMNKQMSYKIRQLNPHEYEILEVFLYEAIFVPEDIERPPIDIIKRPELQIYIKDFGLKDDYALVAEIDGKIIGAVWTRMMKDYGHIDDETPSLSISVLKEYRGLKIGTELMRQMLILLKTKDYIRVSLSVQKDNYAQKMYRDLGFEIVIENDQDYIMRIELKA